MIRFGFGVYLRRLEAEDLPILKEWRNSPHIRKWTRQFDVLSDEDQSRWFARQYEDPTIQMYGIMWPDEKKVDQLVGVTGLTSIDLVNRRAEFSIYIAPDRQGDGLGRKALATLLEHGFKNYGLNLIWGETFDGNPAKVLFERLGFKREGTRRQFYYRDGKLIDAHLYSILRSEWQPSALQLS